jgi:hypothetical protein
MTSILIYTKPTLCVCHVHAFGLDKRYRCFDQIVVFSFIMFSFNISFNVGTSECCCGSCDDAGNI